MRGVPLSRLTELAERWPEAVWKCLTFGRNHVLVWVWLPRGAKGRR